VINECLDAALATLPLMAEGEWQKAMNELHTFSAVPKEEQ
jgi:hypothetical protein